MREKNLKTYGILIVLILSTLLGYLQNLYNKSVFSIGLMYLFIGILQTILIVKYKKSSICETYIEDAFLCFCTHLMFVIIYCFVVTMWSIGGPFFLENLPYRTYHRYKNMLNPIINLGVTLIVSGYPIGYSLHNFFFSK